MYFKYFLFIYLLIIIDGELMAQGNLEYQFALGPSITFPLLVNSTLQNKEFINGKSYPGYNFDLSILINTGAISIGLDLKQNYSKYGFDLNKIVFPEDIAHGTTSSITAKNKTFSMGLGAIFRTRIINDILFIEIIPNIYYPINKKSIQQTFYGYDPNIIDIKTDRDNLFKSGISSSISLLFGTSQPSKSGFGAQIGVDLNLNKHKYNSIGLDVRPIQILISGSYNFNKN